MGEMFSPFYRTSGIVLALCGSLLLLSHPGLSAPRGRTQARKPAPRATHSSAARATAARIAQPALPPAGNQIMRVSEVRAGMKGYGLTVFRGATIQRFDVEVLGVMSKAYMGQPLVLVRLSGGPISQRGAYLIQGMSGSPIYINGKLLGAFSMGNAWPKEPLGMVTPIEDMLEALDPKLSAVPAGETALAPPPAAPDFAATESTPGSSLFQSPAVPSVLAGGHSFKPLGVPVAVSGLSGRNLERVAQVLQPFNMTVMQGPGSMGQPFKAGLTPGAAIGVALMTGDVEMTGIGTVTYRDGDHLLAFGHPMMQIGAAQFPITTAWIHDVFPGLQVSFKIGSAGEPCGTLIQDRPFSIAGKVGPLPAMIPIHYKVKDQNTGRSREFNVRTANHPLLVGQLLPIAVNQGLFSVRPVPGDAVAHVKLKVETEGAGTITRENIYYDPMTIDVTAVRELQELMSLLANNSFRRVPVKSLDMEVTFEDKRPTAAVERIYLSKDRVEPGDEVEVGVVLRPYRKEPVTLKTRIKVPENAANGRALVMVQGGSTRVNLTALLSGGGAPGATLPGGPPPDANLRQVLKRYSERERNDQIVTRLIFPTTAVKVNGERLSQLPSTIVDVMSSSKTTGFRIERDEARKEHDTEYIVEGLQTLFLTVEKENHLERPKTGSGPGGGNSSSGLTAPGSGPGSTLSVGPDLDDPDEAAVFRFTVNGQPRVIRLTPEEGEDGEDARPRKERKSTPSRSPVQSGKSEKPASPAGPDKPKEEKPGQSSTQTPSADEKLVGRQATTWNQTSQADFERGTLANAAVTNTGEVRLAPSLQLLHESSEQFVWSVAGVNGALYAGTGNGGQVLKVGPGKEASVFFRTGELEVHALAKDKAGNLYAGTSPNGKIFRIAPDGKGTELFAINGTDAASDAGGKFVLCLAVADDGTVYAGTGPAGRIYRIKPGQTGAEELCRLPDRSVLSLLLGPDGTLYAGTAEEGAIYRIRPGEGPAAPSIVYDTDQAAITGLALDKAGNLYAACAPSGEIYKIEPDGTPRSHFSKTKGSPYGLLIDASANLYTCSGNVVWRIEQDGTATLLTERKSGQFTCLAWDDAGRMVCGSANVGSVYSLAPATSGSFVSTVHDGKLPARWGRMRFTGVVPDGGTLTIHTRSGNTPEPDASWSQWQEPTAKEGGMYVASPPARFLQYRVLLQAASGSPALRDMAIAYLPRNQMPKVTLATPLGGEILKGEYTLKWSAVDPDKDTLSYEIQYSTDGGKSWNPVGAASGKAAGVEGSGAPTRPTRASVEDALKRFREQVDKDASLSPQEREESYEKARKLVEAYLKENPETASSGPSQPEKSPASGAPASRPSGTTREASFKWDTKQVPDGIYILRVVASDKASNPGEPLSDVAVTEPFIVSNTAPQLFVFERGIVADELKNAPVTGFVAGRVSIKGAQYRVDDGDWTAIEPDDGIWDSAFEHFRFNISGTPSGEHTVEVKVVDAAGNAQTAKAKFKVP
jgi:sugar lactone lactonase YvrE